MGFIFFDRWKKLVIFASIRYTVKGIRASTMHIAFKINICYKKNYMAKKDTK